MFDRLKNQIFQFIKNTIDSLNTSQHLLRLAPEGSDFQLYLSFQVVQAGYVLYICVIQRYAFVLTENNVHIGLNLNFLAKL